MSRFGGDGKGVVQRTPEPGPPLELPGAIERLTVGFRELTDKRGRLEGEVEKLRRRIAEAEGELDQLHLYQLELSWRPPQLEEQRLEQYRDKLAPISRPSAASWTRPRPASRRPGRHWSGSMPWLRHRGGPLKPLACPVLRAGSRAFRIGRLPPAGAGVKAGMSVPPMTVMSPGRPSGQVGHTPSSGWRVCESSGRWGRRRGQARRAGLRRLRPRLGLAGGRGSSGHCRCPGGRSHARAW